ncbi:MAG: T9SS C-terminal target domain-containing protein, partial [Cytophagia bacterium]|nr:T9SS C-terminal target domain-containing protein [Cytophagia bacterium]
SIAIESTCESNLLNINISNAQPGVAYQLFKGETPISSSINGTGSDINTIVLKSSLSAGLNGLNLKASTLDGCQTTTFDNILSYELVNVPQVLSVTGASVCNTGNATLTAQGSSEAVAYRWYDSQLNDATYVQTVGNALTLEGVNESKSYYVTTLNKNGCESLTRSEVSVQVTTVNTPEVSLNGTTLLSSSATGNQWYKNGVIIPGATASSYVVTETGVYTVAVTTNTCSVVSAEITVAITGLEFKGDQRIAIYPNPVNDWLTVEIDEDIASQVKSLRLVDTKGVLIATYNPLEISNGSLLINMANQAKGIYHLAISAADRTLIYRIIKN